MKKGVIVMILVFLMLLTGVVGCKKIEPKDAEIMDQVENQMKDEVSISDEDQNVNETPAKTGEEVIKAHDQTESVQNESNNEEASDEEVYDEETQEMFEDLLQVVSGTESVILLVDEADYSVIEK